MDIAIKKVAERDGKERFVLVKASSREVVTVNDVSEATLRRFFKGKGVPDDLLNNCFRRARDRYGNKSKPPREAVDDAQETMHDDDLLFELGLGDDEVH